MNNCPYCGGELERGRIYKNGRLLFRPDGKRYPLWQTKSGCEKAGSILLAPVSFDNDKFTPVAYVCRSCKKLIMPYD